MDLNDWSVKPRSAPDVYAREILLQLKINSLPIDPQKIAQQLGISADEGELPFDLDGMFVREGDIEIIAINQNIKYLTRKKFSYAHELGHARLPWHGDTEHRCHKKDIAGHRNINPKESEANAFAAELMMPYKFFADDVKRRSFSFETLDELAEEKYVTSLTATAIRFVSLTQEPCAVVLVDNNKILWGYSSKTFYRRIKTKKEVTNESFAYDFFNSGAVLTGETNEVLARAWVETSNPDLTLLESSRSFSDLEVVLTLLNVPEKSDN